MKAYTLFPGCLISLRFPQFEVATIKVLKKLGVELKQLEDITCCPEPLSMQMLNLKSWYTIAARNICAAERVGNDLLTLCNGCNTTLFRVNKDLKINKELRDVVNKILKEVGKKFEGKIEVKSILRVLYEDIEPDLIRKHVESPLHGIKVAVHYGCHIFDELKEYDDIKNPKSLKHIITALGADVVSYKSETLCCAAFARSIDEDISIKAVDEKLSDLIDAGADCLVVICPYCFLQYDLGQIVMNRKLKKGFRIPVLYLTQLMGLAFGFTPYDMGLEFHKVKPTRNLLMTSNK